MLKIGWAKRSLAPDYPVAINGMMYLRVSMGVYTPVLANVLVLENSGDAAIFVSCDMVSVSPEILQRVREIIAKDVPDFPIDKIIINATHTHAGPSIRCYVDFPCDVQYEQGEKVLAFLSGQIADAIKEAWEKRAPGSIAYGYGFAVTGHSRRTTYLDDVGKRLAGTPGFAVNGHAKMYGKTDDPMFAGYENGMDAFINLLYTFDKDDKLTGAVINVPCPSQTREPAWELYASFWHHVRENLTAKYGDIGILGQAAAAGDLSPRQLHYHEAEKRRYKMKYPKEIAEYLKKPMMQPGRTPEHFKDLDHTSFEVVEMIRAIDIANRITEAFDEVLSWAGQEKFSDPVLKHEILHTELAARMFPEEIAEQEKVNYDNYMAKEFITEGSDHHRMIENSKLAIFRRRCLNVLDRFKNQATKKTVKTDIHAVRLGDIAFATNRFELYMNYMHRIQARSPFMQTFIVQLVTDLDGVGTYLATEQAQANKGYSASPYCNLVSPEGGQQLVEETLKELQKIC